MQAYQKARVSRDARYDGKFFVAVKTTKIYCRPICPAPSPKEKNVLYFDSAIAAQEAGFRPCRRCRPESAPQSAAWIGTQAVLQRAIRKIHAGALNHQDLHNFSESLGISERYLRKLFQQYIGTSPRKYGNHVRLMFAKQLLHQTKLPVTDIAFSAGFNSIRRFNDAFKKTIKLTPSEIRNYAPCEQAGIQLKLSYQGHYNWGEMQHFLKQREIPEIETVTKHSYQRSFQIANDDTKATGVFKATHNAKDKAFDLTIELDNINYLMPVVARIRQLLDIDANMELIESHLAQDKKLKPLLVKGLRLPACWDSFEAGVKAILGQQVSVKAAYGHTQNLIQTLSKPTCNDYYLFPTPEQVARADLTFLKMPSSRKETLKSFAHWYLENDGQNLQDILSIKGIGPWTLEYIKLRSGSDSDAFPEKDLGVLKTMEKYLLTDSEQWSPWRSYATLQLWNQL
ncbi:MAG: DNA-3-methyladenine glycosylase 2 family protein [Gammaproteobacteria bacterium]|nr:DNA-3-methyladenine glycosylase 2 family protein [Gammaproteobacteria bacterium]